MSITKESEAKKGNFTQRCLLALGSLCANAPSSTFFTCSDVVLRLIDNQECDNHEFFKIVDWCNISLSQRFQAKHVDLYRTHKKISPQICTLKNARSGYGYRLGMPVEAPVINIDTVHSARIACANPSPVRDVHIFIQHASVPQLTDLILEITDAIVNRHRNVMDDAATARSKLKVLRDAVAGVDV